MSSFNKTSGKKKNIEIETIIANSFTVVSNKSLQVQRLDTDPKETSRGSRTSAETIAWTRHGRSSWWYSLDRQPRRCHVVQQLHAHTQTHAYGHIQLCKHGHIVGQNLARYRSHELGSGAVDRATGRPANITHSCSLAQPGDYQWGTSDYRS